MRGHREAMRERLEAMRRRFQAMRLPIAAVHTALRGAHEALRSVREPAGAMRLALDRVRTALEVMRGARDRVRSAAEAMRVAPEAVRVAFERLHAVAESRPADPARLLFLLTLPNVCEIAKFAMKTARKAVCTQFRELKTLQGEGIGPSTKKIGVFDVVRSFSVRGLYRVEGSLPRDEAAE
jgi:hypothetical protein